MKFNLPNKITLIRIILAIIILLILIIPWYNLNIYFKEYIIKNDIISLKYIIVGVLFVIASLTDFLDGALARSNNMVTDLGKVMDAIADKILVNGLLIVLAYDRVIPVFIPIVIITRDTIVDSLKMISGAKGKTVGASLTGKAKTMLMMIGIALTLFGNFPFIFVGFNLDKLLLFIATILSVVSGYEYFVNLKKYLF